MLSRPARDLRDERGVMLVIFAIILPLILIIGSLVIAIGSWYTHGKHLQTKADASAFAGGTEWAFPCESAIDQRIEARAREYFGQHTQADGTPFTTTAFNPQVGQVQGNQVYTVLNGPDYVDGDTNPTPVPEKTDPNGICASNYLDVKATEQDSPNLWGWLPFWPDIKKKARIRLVQPEGVMGVLPIAVRAPEPSSAAAIFYDEATGDILKVKYFVKGASVGGAVPAGLQPWSTYNTDDASTWADFSPRTATGVAIAISYRGACNTGLPPNNPTSKKIKTDPAPCFEDNKPTLTELCNQTAVTQIVNCYFADPNTSWPSEALESGLYFIRGYPEGDVGSGRPELRGAWLENIDCPMNAAFSTAPGLGTCEVKLTVKVDIGSAMENPPGLPNANEQVRTLDNTEVKYCLVLQGDTGGNACNGQFSVSEELNGVSGGPGDVTFETVPGTHLEIPRGSNGAAVAIQVRMKETTISGPPGCSPTLTTFNNNCRFFYTGASFFSASQDPPGSAVLAAPVQRAFRGDTISGGSVQFLSLTADPDCDGDPSVGDTFYIDGPAASQPSANPDECFLVDMGLKGGLAQDADEQPILFNDGAGPSQMGAVDCDPNVGQGQILTEAVVKGCLPNGPAYGKHPFDWTPLCPTQNDLFTMPNPGAPWNDGRWPPLRCIKTRPTGAMNQLGDGLSERIYGNAHQSSCPSDAAGYVRGRNYWDHETNPLNGGVLGYKEANPAHATTWDPRDKRLVTIFLAPPEAFAGSGQATFPIGGFITVYITGWGRINGGNITSDDPCPGNDPPLDLNTSASGYAVWGHFINYAIPSPSGTPSDIECQPGETLDPCIAALVE